MQIEEHKMACNIYKTTSIAWFTLYVAVNHKLHDTKYSKKIKISTLVDQLN